MIFGLIFLIIAIPFTIAVLSLVLDISTGADPAKEPKETVVSNLSESSATISWVTATETEGMVQFGTSEGSLNLVGNDIRDVGNDSALAYRQHIVELKNLSPSTTYFFTMMNDGEVHGSSSGSFKTHGVSDSVSLPNTIKGSTSPASPYSLVYVYASNGRDTSEVRSTYTSENGTFTYDIADLKTEDGSTLFPLEGAKLVTYINGIDAGKAQKIHATDEDAGALSLDPNSTLVFSKDVDVGTIDTGDDTTDDSGGTTTTTPITSAAPPIGVDIMNNMYRDPDAVSDPTVPTNVFVSNVNDTSFQINWTTLEPTRGFVAYGSSSYSLNKNVLDVRDSSPDVERFTHSIVIVDASMEAEDIIYFKINSNNKLYGVNGGGIAYKYGAPEILSSPPSPSAITGILDYLSGSRLSSESRDFIIFGKVKNSSNQYSTYISAVPAYQSNGWSLSIGGARNAKLDEIIDFSSMEILVLGEYNSSAAATSSDTDETVDVDIEPGLSLDTLRHKREYAGVSALEGTAKPNTNVNVTLASTTYNTTSDSKGEWGISIGNLSQATYKLELNSASQVLGLTFTVNLGILPVTSIDSGVLLTGVGIFLILCGLALTYYIRRSRLIT